MNPIEVFLWSILGGLAGTVLMDIAGSSGEKLGLTTGAR